MEFINEQVHELFNLSNQTNKRIIAVKRGDSEKKVFNEYLAIQHDFGFWYMPFPSAPGFCWKHH
jgi:hypothetical protein